MKRFFTLLVILYGMYGAGAMACLDEGVTFSSQGQINSFPTQYPGCTGIDGNVTISGYNIINLNGLSGITSIQGNLRIVCNDILASLDGLSALRYVGGTLYLEGNMVLPSLEGLDNLAYVGGHIQITDNPAMASLTGLEGLIAVHGDLWLDDNPLLTDLTGLNNVQLITGSVRIFSNQSLMSLSGLETLGAVGGGLLIGGLGHLGSLGNPSLTSLEALYNLTGIGGILEVGGNISLGSLYGLDNISPGTIQQISVYNNSSLWQCEISSICESLSAPNGEIWIENNAVGCNSVEEVREACLGLHAGAGFVSQMLRISPNPAEGKVRVDLPGNQREALCTVTGVNGREVLRTVFSGSGILLDTGFLENGLYLVRITGESGTVTGKLICR